MRRCSTPGIIRHYIMDKTSPDTFITNICVNCFGIGNATIASINTGMRLYWYDIMECCKHVTFSEDRQKVGLRGDVAMTGTRDELLTKWLTDKGYNVTSFNKSVVALIVPSLSFISNKVTKAKEWGIPIYTIDQAYDALK